MDEKDAKKMSTGASTIIIIIKNPSIQNFNTLMDPTSLPLTTNMSENAETTTVQSTPRAT
eukprot:450681-Amphidinium_carterae.1